MKNLRSRLTLLAGAVLMLAFTSVASAQATRTWVSGVGDDANPCSRTAPCKTFAGAISKTANGGEIDCLDPGGFGAVTITKSIVIDCDSGAGGVLSSGVQGVVINANPATDVIILRNLTITGAGTTLGTNGINVIAAKTVGLEDVVIDFYSGSCLTISSSSVVGVYADDSKFINCATAGITAGNNAKVTVTRSLIGFLPGQGIVTTGSGAAVFVTGSTIASVGTALQASAGDFIAASGNTFSNNGVIYNQAGGQIFTNGNNASFGNGPTGTTTAGGVSNQ